MRMRLMRFAFVPAVACAVPAFGATHYVDLNGTNAMPPFTTR
jgi:hypothetical protein